VPWQASPPELDLPEPLVGATTVQSGTNLYLVGGTRADGSVSPLTYQTSVTLDGNFQPWFEGPALPEPRAEAAYVSFSGVPYVIGGLDAAGKPTDTVFVGQLEKGALTGWLLSDGQNGTVDLTLPVPVAGAAAAASPNGMWLVGGRTADGLTTAVYNAQLDSPTPPTPPKLQPWEEETGVPLPAGRADAAATFNGDYLYLFGGTGSTGATSSVYRLFIVQGIPHPNEASGQPEGWIEATGGQRIPAPRARASFFNASGTMYLVGGVDETGAPQFSTLWAIADTSANLSWHFLDQSNLTESRASASAALVGATAFIIGGEGPEGAVADAFRGDISPRPPFFRLGLFGATLPALSIKGEIGQQLGYINAMTVGMINFGLLVAIGVAFSHKRQTLKLFEKVSRGRFTAPPEDDFVPGS
jgi:N-acetylneuraminic acid mutarotase